MKKPSNWNIMLNSLKPLYRHCFILALLFFNCSTETTNDQNDDAVQEKEVSQKHQPKTDTVSYDNGKIEKHGSCNGVIEVSPIHVGYVSLPMGGIVNGIYAQKNAYVQKGKLLATVRHPDYIHLQQQYFESKARLKYLKEEFKRQGALTIENASSIKKLQKAESEFLSEEARCIGLQEQLKMLGIQPDSLSVDSLKDHLPVYASQSGYITAIAARKGKYIQPNSWLFEITDMSELRLVILMNSQKISELNANQKILFGTNSENELKYTATIINQENSVDMNGMIKVYASISNGQGETFFPGMKVKCQFAQN